MNEHGQPLRKRSVTKLKDTSEGAIVASTLGKTSAKASGNSYRTLQITSCILFLVLLTLYFSSRQASELLTAGLARLRIPGSQSSRPSLDLVLHPEDHIYRNATVQHHTWRITSDFRRPDGVRKRVYLVNGEFASPTIEGRSGDTVVIQVENQLDEGVSLHWHGLHMRGTNEMDGAVGLTQCPIPSGASFTYRFELDNGQHVTFTLTAPSDLTADMSSQGTFWWHAHDQTERADGLYGGLVIHRPADTTTADKQRFSYDQERLLMVGDWYHRPAKEVMAWYMRAASFGNEPVPDSLLVNGVGAYNCDDAVPARPLDCDATNSRHLPRLNVDRSKTYRFRIVNTGSLAGFTLTISHASMTAITLDGAHEIDGEPAQSIGILHPGERVDILVNWASPEAAASSELQIVLDTESFRYPNPALTLNHSFPVQDTRRPATIVETSSKSLQLLSYFSLATANASTASRPFDLLEANETILLYARTMKLAKLHNYPFGFFNHTSWKPQTNPPLPLVALPRSSWDENQLVPFISTSTAEPAVVDLIINNIDDGSHPFHLHGYDAYVLSNCADGTYFGSYSPYEDAEPPCGPYNTENPVLRDTVNVPRRGYVVLRFVAENLGLWMLHCHLLWHQAAGMAMGLHIGEGDDSETSITSTWDQMRVQKLLDSCPT